MEVTTIKVGELPDFVSGSLWQNLSPKPITSLRAISQFHNPRAKADDLALIIAHENNQLIVLAGMLPDYIQGNPELPVCTNSCWWADTQKGRPLAVPLFLKAFAAYNQRMFMTDCTPHTIKILQKTNWFEFPEVNPGVRGFLKFSFSEIIPQKFPALQPFKPVFKVADTFMNFFLLPYYNFWKSKFREQQPTTTTVSELDDELYEFIESHSENEFVRRSGRDLEWILRFSWISQETESIDKEKIDYPFSHIVRSFEQYMLKISQQDRTVGLILISLRDGHMKVPYVYFEKENAVEVLGEIYLQALQKGVTTLTIFHPELARKMQAGRYPFIFKKKIKRLVAIPKSLTEFYHKYNHLQDGDGDVAFT